MQGSIRTDASLAQVPRSEVQISSMEGGSSAYIFRRPEADRGQAGDKIMT